MIYEDRLTSSVESRAKKTQGQIFLPKDIDVKILQTLEYEYPHRPIVVETTTNEFTCLCPYSGLPDYAFLTIRYVPKKKIIEMKSLKYYIYAFRNVKIYNEHVVNKILEDLVKVLSPREMTVSAEFTNRGGAVNKATATYKRSK